MPPAAFTPGSFKRWKSMSYCTTLDEPLESGSLMVAFVMCVSRWRFPGSNKHAEKWWALNHQLYLLQSTRRHKTRTPARFVGLQDDKLDHKPGAVASKFFAFLSTKEPKLMVMDEIIDITRQIGRQQGENMYYRACYALLKHLQELVSEASDDLLRLQQSGAYGSPEEEYYPVYQIVRELQTSINNLVDQACHAQLACEEFCDVDPRFSARDLFSSLELPKATSEDPCEGPLRE